jgi:hypothetical protein
MSKGTPHRPIRIDADLWAKAQAKAAQEGTTASAKARDLLAAWVEDKPMTSAAAAFLKRYAAACDTTPSDILAGGRVVATCSCGDDSCEGWQVIPEDCLLPWRNEKVVIRG